MTERTSPMSSPSLSPHVSPSMHSSRGSRHHGDGCPTPPPAWHLSDSSSNEYYYHPRHHHRAYPYLQRSIPEENRHEHPDGHDRYYRRGGGSDYAVHHQQHHHHGVGGGPRSMPTMVHHRSPIEILKTLLRKKACLYEPETSFAVSLVTWLLGRRMSLVRGYFTRQQLQSCVHSCVAGKIDEGRVTRTKVNRCMQVILNSCFHYIIPPPSDGGSGSSEGCAEAFRSVFSREAAEEEHLLRTLPPPWNDLNLRSMNDDRPMGSHCLDSYDDGDHHHPPFGGKHRGRDSSAASQADDSLDSQKRSVLLCFNENIRCAADVFRCHNEFIRDIAHAGGLSLSPEDWQTFFSGTKFNRKGRHVGQLPLEILSLGRRARSHGSARPVQASYFVVRKAI
jgi:hypothetical protein